LLPEAFGHKAGLEALNVSGVPLALAIARARIWCWQMQWHSAAACQGGQVL
jgi:hypothetical protein